MSPFDPKPIRLNCPFPVSLAPSSLLFLGVAFQNKFPAWKSSGPLLRLCFQGKRGQDNVRQHTCTTSGKDLPYGVKNGVAIVRKKGEGETSNWECVLQPKARNQQIFIPSPPKTFNQQKHRFPQGGLRNHWGSAPPDNTLPIFRPGSA